MRTLAEEFFSLSNGSSSPSNLDGTNRRNISAGIIGAVAAVVMLIGTGMALPYQTYKEEVRRARGIAKKEGRSRRGSHLSVL